MFCDKGKDVIEDALDVVHDILVGNADDTIVERFQVSGPFGIVSDSFRSEVTLTVDFED